MSIAGELARFVTSTSVDDLPLLALERARMAIASTIAGDRPSGRHRPEESEGPRKTARLLEGIGARVGEIYLVDALEIIAGSDDHALIFHCSAGKDRTGVLAAHGPGRDRHPG